MGQCTSSKTIGENRVINLSSLELSEDELSLLNRGLSFTPTPPIDKLMWTKDINMFARKLALHKHFEKENNEREQPQNMDKQLITILEQLQA